MDARLNDQVITETMTSAKKLRLHFKEVFKGTFVKRFVYFFILTQYLRSWVHCLSQSESIPILNLF